MADDVDDGQVDDGPVDSTLWLHWVCVSEVIWFDSEAHMHSLEFAKPGVSDDGAQYRREVAEAAESMVDGGREILVPVQVGDEVERQQCCERNTQAGALTAEGTDAPYSNKTLQGFNPILFKMKELY